MRGPIWGGITLNLFSDTPSWQKPLVPGVMAPRRFAREHAPALLQAVTDVARQSPSRQMVTPGGYTTSVAMTDCGALGWATDCHSYLYNPVDLLINQTWSSMPAVFRELALVVTVTGGYPNFSPDAYLINRYQPGAKPSLHQDKGEQDLWALIVPVSLGLPTIFQFGELQRGDPLQWLLPEHGDMVVWGGESRLLYHGIQPLKAGYHPETGDCRHNLTSRQAGGR